jgi:hypothetical protein
LTKFLKWIINRFDDFCDSNEKKFFLIVLALIAYAHDLLKVISYNDEIFDSSSIYYFFILLLFYFLHDFEYFFILDTHFCLNQYFDNSTFDVEKIKLNAHQRWSSRTRSKAINVTKHEEYINSQIRRVIRNEFHDNLKNKIIQSNAFKSDDTS